MKRQNRVVFSGTSLSHNSSTDGISMINGMETTDIKAVENLLSFSANEKVFLISPAPAAFIIWGFMAFKTDVATNETAEYT